MAITITTDRLISATEARRNFGKLLAEVAQDETKYFVILDNGKVAGVLGSQDAFQRNGFADTNVIRKGWGRYTDKITDAFNKLSRLPKRKLPKLLR